jgi:hypothetical protein
MKVYWPECARPQAQQHWTQAQVGAFEREGVAATEDGRTPGERFMERAEMMRENSIFAKRTQIGFKLD